MTVSELRELLDLCDNDLEVCFDADTVAWYDHKVHEDPTIETGQYVEDGFTETSFPSKEQQSEAESAYLLLKC
jgi:hypothetical protein